MILALLQARMSSTRLPGKVMRPLMGQPMIGRQIERVRRAKRIDRLVVATSLDPTDDPLSAWCETAGVEIFRGALDDVLARFEAAVAGFGPADHVVRLTGDCPLADPEVVDACIALHLDSGADYTSNGIERTYPDGLDVEVVRASALAEAARRATDPYDREHVTPFIYHRPDRFGLAHLKQPTDLSAARWTVDRPEDFEFVRGVYEALYPNNPCFSTRDVLELACSPPTRRALAG